MTTFATALDIVDELPLDQQEELINIISHRIHDMRRKELIEAVEQSRREYEEGKAKTATPDEIVDEMFS